MSSSELQNAINNAQFGDSIEVQAGSDYNGSFVLPDKGSNPNNLWITIRSSRWQQLPQEGTRIAPNNSSLLARLIAQDGNPVLSTAGAAHNYRLVGLEITANPSLYVNGLVTLGGDGNTQTTPDQAPRYIVVDRCYIHGGSSSQRVKRGVYLNAANSAIVDSYISDIHSVGEDNQAVYMSNTPGVLLIRNNYLEAAGENFLSGGSAAASPEMVPSDVTFLHNYFYKQPKWNPADSAYDGSNWTVKNIFEIKDGKRFLVKGNIFSHNWPAAQDGTAILMQLITTQEPNAVLKDVTFIDNLVQHASRGMAFLAWDQAYPTVAKRLLVKNNVFDDINGTASTAFLFNFVNADTDVTVQNNSSLNNSQRLLWMYSRPNINFTFQNNIVQLDYWGVLADGSSSGWPSLVQSAGPQESVASRFAGNLLVNNGRSFLSVAPQGTDSYPSTNQLVSDASSIGFDTSTNDSILKYRLTGNSPYLTSGLNGTTPGASIDELSQALSGVESGVSTYYRIVNRGSGKVLDVDGQSTGNGAGVAQWDYWGGANQQWQIIQIDSSNYRIVSRNSGKPINVSAWSTDNGASVIQWDYLGGANEQWQLIPTDSGYYRIVNKNSGKAISVDGQSTQNNAGILQWDYVSVPTQQWQLVPIQ